MMRWIKAWEFCSSGSIGYVFRYDAEDLFVDYARRCEEKQKIAEIILKVNQKDNYGIRGTLIDCTRGYPESGALFNLM